MKSEEGERKHGGKHSISLSGAAVFMQKRSERKTFSASESIRPKSGWGSLLQRFSGLLMLQSNQDSWTLHCSVIVESDRGAVAS